MSSQVQKTGLWAEKEKPSSNPSVNRIKSPKRLKTPKRLQDGVKLNADMKLEDIFLNSEYFKHHSGQKSTLSFCSGDNVKNQWTVDSGFEIPLGQKPNKIMSDAIKSDTAMMTEKDHDQKPCSGRMRKKNQKEDSNVEQEKLLEGILSGKRRLDGDLITLITEQMFLAERELQITRTHLMETISKLNERDLEILQLQEKIRNLQKSSKAVTSKDVLNKDIDSCTKTSEDYQRLILASEKLKKQVKDMEVSILGWKTLQAIPPTDFHQIFQEFLNDYGLVWVGNKDSAQKPDFDKIIKSFQRLNAVASQPKIIQTTLGAKFEIPKELPVILYSNGFLLNNYDFREFNKTSTHMFLQDVEDGYFPSELQSQFPEGVPFEIIDKRNEFFSQSPKVFQGSGNRLGSMFEGKRASIVYLEPLKSHKKQECSHICLQHLKEKSSSKKFQRKGFTKISSYQEDTQNYINPESISKIYFSEKEMGCQNQIFQNKILKVKIRVGKEKLKSFILEVPDNARIYEFQQMLENELLDINNEKQEKSSCPPDFEIHLYGASPFRLSDHWNKYVIECGIKDSSVLNLTQI